MIISSVSTSYLEPEGIDMTNQNEIDRMTIGKEIHDAEGRVMQNKILIAENPGVLVGYQKQIDKNEARITDLKARLEAIPASVLTE